MQYQQQIPFTLSFTKNYFYMECHINSQHLAIKGSLSKRIVEYIPNNYIQINRYTNKIRQIPKQQYENRVDSIPKSHSIGFYVLLGTIIINKEPYLIVATQASSVATYIQYPIYSISDVQFFPYRSKSLENKQESQQEGKIIAQLKGNYLNKYFYFSYKENIASSIIQQTNNLKVQHFNEFAWNKAIITHFRRSKIDNCWAVPIIQGFVAEIQQKNINLPYRYLSISRRSTHMSGTRFNSRGLDQKGHTSNFVQTEQLFIYNNKLYAHVSLRGSVPLFWKQVKVRSHIEYTKQQDINEQQIIRKHYEQIQFKYKAEAITINLLSKQLQPQKQLRCQRFEASFKRNITSKYLFFDLNQQIKDIQGQRNVSKFIESNLSNIFGESPYLQIDLETKEINKIQSKVPRINCLDCLDRTNVIMARISQHFTRFVYKQINQQFIKKLIKVWTKIGNRISQIYCGTGSVASHMTKKQNNSFKTFLGGAFISFNRYINANTTDMFKQECIEYFLGKKQEYSKTDYFGTNICLSKIKQQNYAILNKIKMSIITFNTSKISIPQQELLQNFINAIDVQSSIIVFHLQQVFEEERWIQILQRQLQQRSYLLLVHCTFKGLDLLSIVFTKKQQIQKISYKFNRMIQIPLRSYGALALFVQINNSILCLINSKLESGYQNKLRRVDNFNQIHKFLLAQTQKSNLLLMCDAIVLAGNLNLRLSNNIDKQFKYKNLIEQLHSCSSLKTFNKRLIDDALKYDQLLLLKQSEYIDYLQGDICFLPTYKWQKKTTLDKIKHPAWCDRILFSNGLKSIFRLQSNKKTFKCKQYSIIQQNYGSSHKGVVATLQFDVKLQVQSIKRQLILKYLYS